MTDNTHDDVTRPISIIDRAVELLAPRDEVARIILRAAVVAAADVTHETGDPDTFAALLVDTVREAIGSKPRVESGCDEYDRLRAKRIPWPIQSSDCHGCGRLGCEWCQA
jgi:hypothetical protein